MINGGLCTSGILFTNFIVGSAATVLITTTRISAQGGTLFLVVSIPVKHKKQNQMGARPPPGCVFGVQPGLRQIQALITTKKNEDGGRMS